MPEECGCAKPLIASQLAPTSDQLSSLAPFARRERESERERNSAAALRTICSA